MAVEARWAVTQPFHGPGGELVYDVGHEFPLDAKLPDGLRTALTAVEVPDAPPAKAAPAPKPPAKSPAGRL